VRFDPARYAEVKIRRIGENGERGPADARGTGERSVPAPDPGKMRGYLDEPDYR
jgi:hypothetical protein